MHYTSRVALLNLDAGERDDESEELWAPCDVLSIACGGHAGDERSMARVVAYCASHGRPAIGAHPSYPDREGFGRRTIAIDAQALRDSIAAQCAALGRVAAAHGARVQYVKPHGALYHDADTSIAVAQAVVAGARDALGDDIALIGSPRRTFEEVVLRFGPRSSTGTVRYLREGFADRATRPDGSLVPRTEPGALITEPAAAAARARQLASEVDTICVHGDTPGAIAIVRAVREALDG